MKNIIDIMNIETAIVSLYEASILDIDGTFEEGDKMSEDIFKLQWDYAYLSNLPNRNQSNLVGGLRGIYRKYFEKKVPELFTDRHSTLQTLLNYPERKHKLNKLDTDGDYIATYILQCELDKHINSYDFKENKMDRRYLEEKITEHMSKILNDKGKESIRFEVRERYKGGNQPIISIAMITKYTSDFKPNTPRYCDEIMCFNYTKGQYYYK